MFRRPLLTRSLKTEFSRKLMALQVSGAFAQEIRESLGYSRVRKRHLEGDLADGEAYCGASAGLIKEIVSAVTLIEKVMGGYGRAIERLI